MYINIKKRDQQAFYSSIWRKYGCLVTYFYIISFIIPEVALQSDNNLALGEKASLLMNRNVDRFQPKKPLTLS